MTPATRNPEDPGGRGRLDGQSDRQMAGQSLRHTGAVLLYCESGASQAES